MSRLKKKLELIKIFKYNITNEQSLDTLDKDQFVLTTIEPIGDIDTVTNTQLHMCSFSSNHKFQTKEEPTNIDHHALLVYGYTIDPTKQILHDDSDMQFEVGMSLQECIDIIDESKMSFYF